MRPEVVNARRPNEVAKEVEALLERGCRSFVVVSIDHGGMLDLERLGAARYAAGFQSCVELGVGTPAAAAAAR